MAMRTTPIAALRHLSVRLALSALVLLALAPAAYASVGVGSGAAAPKLRVDAKDHLAIAEMRPTSGWDLISSTIKHY